MPTSGTAGVINQLGPPLAAVELPAGKRRANPGTEFARCTTSISLVTIAASPSTRQLRHTGYIEHTRKAATLMSATNTECPVPTAAMSTSAAGVPTATPTVPSNATLVEPDFVRSATPEFEFYYQWSLEERKQSLRHLADSLRYLTTLAAALLAGSLTYLTGRVDQWAQGAAALMLFARSAAGWAASCPGRCSARQRAVDLPARSGANRRVQRQPVAGVRRIHRHGLSRRRRRPGLSDPGRTQRHAARRNPARSFRPSLTHPRPLIRCRRMTGSRCVGKIFQSVPLPQDAPG